MVRSRDERIRYEGLVEAKRESAARAPSVYCGQDFDTWRYAPPVRVGSVLCAESAHIAAPRALGCIEGSVKAR